MIKCDRCKKEVDGFEDETGMTAGYFKYSGWKDFMSESENIVCDGCMFLDERYIKIYGVHK